MVRLPVPSDRIPQLMASSAARLPILGSGLAAWARVLMRQHVGMGIRLTLSPAMGSLNNERYMIESA